MRQGINGITTTNAKPTCIYNTTKRILFLRHNRVRILEPTRSGMRKGHVKTSLDLTIKV